MTAHVAAIFPATAADRIRSAYFPTGKDGRLVVRAEDFASPNVPDGFATVWQFRAKWELPVLEDAANGLDGEGLSLLDDDDLTERYTAAYADRFGGQAVTVAAPPCIRALGIETVRAYQTHFLLMGATAAWGRPLVEIERATERAA